MSTLRFMRSDTASCYGVPVDRQMETSAADILSVAVGAQGERDLELAALARVEDVDVMPTTTTR
jgi:hypothetical protein